MTDTPIPTLAALAGLVEALERCSRAPADRCGHCNRDIKDCDEYETSANYSTPWCLGFGARAALASWRARLPMAEDRDTMLVLAAVLAPCVAPGLARAASTDALAALDARMGKP